MNTNVKNMSNSHKVMCGFIVCISASTIQYELMNGYQGK